LYKYKKSLHSQSHSHASFLENDLRQMDVDERNVLAIAMSLIQGIGPAYAKKAVEHFGSLELFFKAKRKDLEVIPGISRMVLESFFNDGVIDRAKVAYEALQKEDARVYFIADQDYPYRLSWCNDAPVVLFGKGKCELNVPRLISVVGMRQVSQEGRELCEELINELQGCDVTVVSGLAYGVDILAHRACLKRGIPTVACLAHGLDRVYPNVHQREARQMMEEGGLLSEYFPGVMPDRNFFPRRNRIIAGLTDATLVVESGIKGGSMITARLAHGYNREVFAYPGSVRLKNKEGCNFLIRSLQAQLVRSGADLVESLAWKSVEKEALQLRIDLDENEQAVLTCLLPGDAIHIDELSYKLKMKQGALATLLLQMELKGLINTRPGKHYVRC
jgi:DNA processing protein